MSNRKRQLLDSVLTNSESAVCIMDDERRIRFVSPGMEKLTGWAADELQGLICDPASGGSGTPKDLLTAALAPGAAVLSGQPASVRTLIPLESGTSRRIILTFVPFLNASAQVDRVVAYCSEGALPATGANLAQKLHAEITSLRLEFRRRFTWESFFGNHSSIRTALVQAELLKKGDTPYSIVGPNGSGRRHLARVIHVAGEHPDHSFVTLSCRLLTCEQLLDTLRQMKQLVDETNRPHHQHVGTLALIDCDHCPAEVQRWLLDPATQRSHVRLVSISETRLKQVQSEGWMTSEFADLFASVEIQLPALHHRSDDIAVLAQHFLELSRRTQQTSAEGFSPEVLKQLQFYRWPGNVRELRQVITDACQNSFENELSLDDLPFAFRAGLEAQQLPRAPRETEQTLDQILHQFEIDVLQKTLAACKGNKADAARRLGLTRPKLYRRLKTLGLDDSE